MVQADEKRERCFDRIHLTQSTALLSLVSALPTSHKILRAYRTILIAAPPTLRYTGTGASRLISYFDPDLSAKPVTRLTG